jgi:hypothetical protein
MRVTAAVSFESSCRISTTGLERFAEDVLFGHTEITAAGEIGVFVPEASFRRLS